MVAETKKRGVGEIGRARASVTAIETLATIRRQARRVATADELTALAGWSGWGPLAKAFAPDDKTWAELAERINTALPERDVALGLKGTSMAFYTPAPIAAAMWDMLRLFGYTDGPVAELGCGGGVFFGTAPEGTPLVGVERDRTAAEICQLLHPHARVITSALEDTHLPGTFSAVIGNVPFGDVQVFDPTAPDDVTGSIHNYFIWRAVQSLTPGGYAVLLTSRYTMDNWRAAARDKLAEVADFVGAVRLPNGALGGGTDALADVVILRRKGGVKRPTHPRDWAMAKQTAWDASTSVNEWWSAEPDAVLGRMGKGKTNQWGMGLIVEPDGNGDVAQRMTAFTRTRLVPQARKRNLMWAPPPRPEEFDAAAAGVVSSEGWIDGSLHLDGNGGVQVVKGGRAWPLPRPGIELLRLLRLRDLAVDLIRLEADHTLQDQVIEPVRADVRAAYAEYFREHGPLNRYTQRPAGVDQESGAQLWGRRYPTMQGFRHDPDAALVFALEMFDDDDDGDVDAEDMRSRAKPAPIQTSRQNLPPVRRTHTEDPEQALAWSLDMFGGKVRLDFIGLVLGRPLPEDPAGRETARRDLAALLGDKVFRDPETLDWVTAEAYLSGDVRDKYRTAVQAATEDGQFSRNVQALEQALPKWLTPAEIVANLGTPWIGPRYLEAFLAEVIGVQAVVKRAAGKWDVESKGHLRHSVVATAQWGTPDKDAFELTELALNGKTPTVYKRVIGPDGEEKRVKDHDRSMLAAEKQQEIRQRFSEWVWADAERAKHLENLYNNRYNCLVPRSYDGSHITIHGMAPWFKPYGHQLSFVARAICTPACLCGHPVGAGKTYTMAMTAIKLKQIGLINKPMIVVPNHLIEQIDREIRQLFPGAKILTGSAKTISANRLAFTARCTTGDWDLVLVTHSAFNAMGVSAETMARYHEEMESELRAGVVSSAGGKLKGRMVKNLAKALDRMTAEIKKLRNTARPKDAGVQFEQLGVDYVEVDEFHYYKNLAMPCETEGFSIRPSKRATDLDMKLRYLRERNNGGPHAALFSGTPVSNTMLELYVCMHYTMRPYLKEIGLGSADQWAAAYVQFVTSVEVTVDGGDFQMRTRPALFVNAPELRVLLSQVADIRTADQLGLKRPAADLHVVACEPTELQAWYSEQLVSRAEDVRNRIVSLRVDNMLKICTDGRRMATDPALVGIDDDGEHKLHIVAHHIIAEWQANPGKIQAAFLDIGTPKKRRYTSTVDYQTYGRLRRLLVDAGMDAGRIRIIHDANDDSTKARLFRDCRNGKVDVILGSTDKLGVGTNIQKLIVAMHHIDAPFRPADVEQRDGRGLRPGNIHKVVKIYRYVTKRTFDAYMWQMLTRKLGFISQMLSGNLDRTVEDVTGDDVLSFAAIKAAATDQPLLQEKAEIEAQLKKLTLKERAHRQMLARMRSDAPRFRDKARTKERQAKAWEAIAAAAADIDLSDDTVVAAIHEAMDGFRYWRPPMRFGKLAISWSSWETPTEHPETQPLLCIDGGAGVMDEQCYKFWEVADVRKRLKRVLSSAAGQARSLREAQTRAEQEADRCDELAATAFEQAAELASVRARLDQVEAELRQAADKKGPSESDGDVVLDADAETVAEVDFGELVDLAGIVDFAQMALDELDEIGEIGDDGDGEPDERVVDGLDGLLAGVDWAEFD